MKLSKKENAAVDAIMKTHDEIIGFFIDKGYSDLHLLGALPLVVDSCLKQSPTKLGSDELLKRFIITLEAIHG